MTINPTARDVTSPGNPPPDRSDVLLQGDVTTRTSQHDPDPSLHWLASVGDRCEAHEGLTLFDERMHNRIVLRLPKAGATQLSHETDVVVVFDGCLHDRRALEECLGRDVIPQLNDAELIAHAYRARGRDVVPLVRGEFTLLIWGSASGDLLLARDPLGARPLFFAGVGGCFRASPSLEALVACRVPTDINAVGVADWVVTGSIDVSETLYRHVHRLPPGHLLERRANGVSILRYWRPRGRQETADWNAEDAFERFDSLMRQAVRRRLRHGRAGVFLSGGIDSAVIAAVAVEESRQAGIPSPLALSMKLPHPLADEERVQREIAKDLSVPIVVLRMEDAAGADGTLIAGLRMARRSSLPPVNPWEAPYDALVLEGIRKGCGAFLSGEGGNHVLEPGWADAAKLFWHAHGIQLARLLKARRSHDPFSVPVAVRQIAWRYGVRRAMRNAVYSFLRQTSPSMLRRGLTRRATISIPDWAVPNGELRKALSERWVAENARREKPRAFEDESVSVLLESLYATSTRFGIAMPNPYFDVDVVEFLEGAPLRVLLHGGRFKGLAHSSYRRRVAAASAGMLGAPSVEGFFGALLDGEAPWAMRYLGGLERLTALGVVQPKVASILTEPCRSGTMSYYQRWQVLSSEAWLRTH